MMESIMRVAAGAQPPKRLLRTGPRDAALRVARTCYDHLAGRLAVAITDKMLERGLVEIEGDAGAVTADGHAFLKRLGIDADHGNDGRSRRRVFLKPCLDWSERRPHLAGRIGQALHDHCFNQHWVHRIDGGRALTITRKGEQALQHHFGIRADDIAQA
jgi:hypothetical protein